MDFTKKLVICVFLLLFSVFCSAEDALEGGKGKEPNRVFNLNKDIDLITTIKFSYDKPRIVLKSVYPVLESTSQDMTADVFNELVTNVINDAVAKFKTEIAEAGREQQAIAKKKIKNDLYIDYDASVVHAGKTLITSIRFNIQGVVAGKSNAYHYHDVLNFNLKNAEQVQLSDLFLPDSDYLTILSNYARRKLLRQFNNKAMVLAGTEPREDNFKKWNIKTNGLLFTFDKYQVAPSIQGAVTLLVPFSILRSSIAPDSLLGCLHSKRKRCVRGNLLTGGFIDEAINTRHGRFNPMLGQL